MNILDRLNLMQDYESAVLETFREYDEKEHCSCSYDELPVKSTGGIPLIMQRRDGKLHATFTEDTHALIIGATRSGKTTSYIIPAIFAKANQSRKDSMLITDPKGELYNCCAAMLKEKGYRIILLNFRDYRNSECWNPLTPIFRKYQAAMHLSDKVNAVKEGRTYYNEFNGKKFLTQSDLRRELDIEYQIGIDVVTNDIDSLACIVAPTKNTKDPYWEDSARQLFKAFIWAMLEDSMPDKNGNISITEDNFSFKTMLSILSSFGGSGEDNGFFNNRSSDSVALQLAKEPVVSNADKTRMCVLSTFNSKIAPFREVVSRQITSCNTFEMDDLTASDKPVALFISYRDEIKVSYDVIQMFITAAYTKLIASANEMKQLKLERPFYFILDEFGNLPQIKDFENTISACGGRNIWLILVLQSYAQLYNIYGHNVGEIIKDNLNMHVFLGTNNPETKKLFSDECGYKTIISPLSALNGDGSSITRFDKDVVPLIPVSKLNHFEIGECVITRTNARAVLWSRLERSYLCPEFECEKTDSSDYGSKADFSDKKYLYQMKKTNKSAFSKDWDF